MQRHANNWYGRWPMAWPTRICKTLTRIGEWFGTEHIPGGAGSWAMQRYMRLNHLLKLYLLYRIRLTKN
jgi:hypothetical protein